MSRRGHPELLGGCAWLRQKVATGLESLDRGEGLDGEAAFEEPHEGLGAEDDPG